MHAQHWRNAAEVDSAVLTVNGELLHHVLVLKLSLSSTSSIQQLCRCLLGNCSVCRV
jgi:hypothetical protein